MENKITPIQALEELRKECNAQFFDENGKKWYTTGKHLDYRCNIIDQALNELEEIKVFNESLEKDIDRLNQQCIDLHLKDSKQSKILEVLKNKVVAKERIKNCENVNAYNNYVLPPFSQLTETEFNLIKEWLK